MWTENFSQAPREKKRQYNSILMGPAVPLAVAVLANSMNKKCTEVQSKGPKNLGSLGALAEQGLFKTSNRMSACLKLSSQ